MLAIAATLVAIVGLTRLSSQPAAAEEGLYDPALVPTAPADKDPSPVELGLRFSVTQPGTVVGVRFFGATSTTGANTGSLWTGRGYRLATATFPAAQGRTWHTVTFDKPVAVRPGRTYVVSYFAPDGSYLDEQNGFDAPVTRGSIAAPAGAGVYTYGAQGGFPTQVWRNSNYFVDVRFLPRLPTPSGGATTETEKPTPTAPTTPPSPTMKPSTSTPTPSATNAPTAPTPTTSNAAPPTDGYPDASTTGADSTGLTSRSATTVTTDGAVLENIQFNGQLTIRADNVVVRNVVVHSNGTYGIETEGRNVLIEDSTVAGTPPATVAGIAATSGSMVARRVDVSGSEDGVRLTNNSVLADSYVHDLAGDSQSHFDGVTADGFTGWQINHNTIINNHSQTAAVWIGDPRYGPSEGVLQQNWLEGGGYTIYAGPGTGQGLRVLGNAFSTREFPDAGSYGLVAYWSNAGNTWSGNVWADGPKARQPAGP